MLNFDLAKIPLTGNIWLQLKQLIQTSKTVTDNSLYCTRSTLSPILFLGGRNIYFLQFPHFVSSVAKCYVVLQGLTTESFRFCPHSAFVCFVRIWEQTAIISLYSINWLVCVTETENVYCAVRTGSLYTILRSAHTAVFMCFVWIWEQTAIISLYSINWLVCVTETECLLCGTDICI